MAFISNVNEITCMYCKTTAKLTWKPGVLIKVQYENHSVEKKIFMSDLKIGHRKDEHGEEIYVSKLANCELGWLNCDCEKGGRPFP